MNYFRHTIIILVALSILSGCGQKGPLYLPQAQQTTSEK
jgi:predicted small lipoprotein YifL